MSKAIEEVYQAGAEITTALDSCRITRMMAITG
jgi:hypothetical protein